MNNIFYILTIPFRIIATILALIFMPLIVILEAISDTVYMSDAIFDIFKNIWAY